MAGGVGVLAGVPVRRAVAAKRDAALLAGAQMNPFVADLHALRAFAALRIFDRCDRVEMRTTAVSHCSPVGLDGIDQSYADQANRAGSMIVWL